jgi:hypothetical protein
MRLSLALHLGSLALSHGFILDASCTLYQDLITTGMKSALDFAQAGANVFNSPSTDKNILQAQKDLTTYLFEGALHSQSDYDLVANRFGAVLKYNVNGGNPEQTLDPVKDKAVYPTLTSDKLIFFCDYSRYTPGKLCDGSSDPTQSCDTLMQFDIAMDDVYNYCLNPTSTHYYEVRDSIANDKSQILTLSTSNLLAWWKLNRATTIQLCPWWLQKMSNAKYKTLADLGTGSALALSTEAFANIANSVAPGKTAMDTMDLTDVVLLHELTHGIANPPPTDDIGNAYGKSIRPPPLFKYVSGCC